MDIITSSPSGWPLPSGGVTPGWDPDDTMECTKRQHLTMLNQQLLFAKAKLDVDSFRSILSEIENIRCGLDRRYQKAPPAFVISAVTSAFSEDGRSNDDNAARGKDKKKWFSFSNVSKILRHLLFFRRRSRAKDVAQGVTDESRNESL